MKYVEEQCNGTNRDPKTTVLTIVFPLLCNERSVGRSRPMVAAFLQTCLSVAKENTFKVPKQLKKKSLCANCRGYIFRNLQLGNKR